MADILIDKLRAAINSEQLRLDLALSQPGGDTCEREGHWDEDEVGRHLAAARKILEAWDSGERAAAMKVPPGFTRELFGRQQVLRYVLEALAEAYGIEVPADVR